MKTIHILAFLGLAVMPFRAAFCITLGEFSNSAEALEFQGSSKAIRNVALFLMTESLTQDQRAEYVHSQLGENFSTFLLNLDPRKLNGYAINVNAENYTCMFDRMERGESICTDADTMPLEIVTNGLATFRFNVCDAIKGKCVVEFDPAKMEIRRISLPSLKKDGITIWKQGPGVSGAISPGLWGSTLEEAKPIEASR